MSLTRASAHGKLPSVATGETRSHAQIVAAAAEVFAKLRRYTEERARRALNATDAAVGPSEA